MKQATPVTAKDSYQGPSPTWNNSNKRTS